MRRLILAATLGSLLIPALPAYADPPYHAPAHGWRAKHHDGYRYAYTNNGIRYWRGHDGRYYCLRPDGTTGLLIGAVAGALLGRTIDTRGDRTPGTVLGAVGGALLGREIDRSSARCR